MKRTLLALLALPALALGAIVPASAAHADDYVFAGRIITAFQGTPIAGVEVYATPPGGAAAAVAVTDADGGWHFTTTDEELYLFFDGAPQSRGGRVDVRGNLIARVPGPADGTRSEPVGNMPSDAPTGVRNVTSRSTTAEVVGFRVRPT